MNGLQLAESVQYATSELLLSRTVDFLLGSAAGLMQENLAHEESKRLRSSRRHFGNVHCLTMAVIDLGSGPISFASSASISLHLSGLRSLSVE